jgi:hypothetical protein
MLHDPEYDIISTKDKDLNCIPGRHYNWSKGEEVTISEPEANAHFYSQVITGDTSDNIPGLYGVGGSSTYVKNLKTIESEYAMFESVALLYKQRFGSYWSKFMEENCKLLWILQKRDPDWMKLLEVEPYFQKVEA